MCKHGEDQLCYVPIPANLSYTGHRRWDWKAIDACIAPIVNALNNVAIHTAQSCCGHGKTPGRIDLHDGRVVIIMPTQAAADEMLQEHA